MFPEEQANHFHYTIDQFLFLCKRACPDIHIIVVFLTAIVRSPYEDDWEKLKWGLTYLKGTLYLQLYLRADFLNMIFW